MFITYKGFEINIFEKSNEFKYISLRQKRNWYEYFRNKKEIEIDDSNEIYFNRGEIRQERHQNDS